MDDAEYYRVHEQGAREVEVFEEVECGEIQDALAQIDCARAALVRSQNTLVKMLNGMTDCAREEFIDWYQSGGITARDWKAYISKPSFRPTVVVRGQLRLVISNQTMTTRVDDDGPRAA